MSSLRNSLAAFAQIALLVACAGQGRRAPAHAVLISADMELDERVDASSSAVVLRLEDGDDVRAVAARATELARDGFAVGYWIEVARCTELADAHTELMASLQGHEQWRALHPHAPLAGEGEVLKVHPWAPITTREGFDRQLERVRALLQSLPAASTVYLNDLQGAPSACGCGHSLCRWATDYFLRQGGRDRKLSTAQELGPSAAADFVDAVRSCAKGAMVVPVWTAECGPGDAACHGVPCFEGACWPALARQFLPIVQRNTTIAVLVPDGADVEATLTSLAHISRGSVSVTIDRNRLVPVAAGLHDASRGVERRASIEQSWTPRLYAPPTPSDR
jgi:hypothetical protein